MAQPSRPPRTPGPFDRFWQRVTEGLELQQLWTQFRKDAHSSYRLYARDVDASRLEGASRRQHYFHVMGQFFWAIVEKLTPARRVLLVVALILLFVPGGGWSYYRNGQEVTLFAFNNHFFAGLLLLLLLVLETADRVVMKRDLQIAKEIQAWLLPAQPPAVPGLELAFATRPANTVAGDYYDVFARPSVDGHPPTFLLAVADVAGKSIPAAMLMATFQASLKTLSTTPGSLPELAARINAYACSSSQEGRRFTTAFLAEYDPATRRLAYINAGHNDPILRRATGAIERLNVGGLPFGVLANAPWQAGEVTLHPGDWLAIFTDGVVEAENARQEEYGEFRLVARINAGILTPPAAMLQGLFADIDAFAGDAPQHDDITCLLLRAL